MGRAFEFRKARKMKRWGNMSRMFTKYGRDIAMAVKSGGPSLDGNSRLRAIVQSARGDNMPKDNIERAIKNASDKSSADFKELVYEGKGPFGIAILVETATDNPTRTVANLRVIFNRNGGTLGNSGSIDFLFDRKCRFKIANNNINVEELEFELIDFGAEEASEDEDGIVIYGEFESFGSIQKFLEEKGYQIITAEFERIPNDTKELTREQQEEVYKIVEKLEEDDDVQNVYTTMA
ncbi:MAG: YebC/PmpR family DNA-binding transcriptional regulator [Opitutaceae bacterium]|nr:YebC/PmpR family DNA-binding transcriptional regulator [Cytophagales bacterium]